MLIETLPAQRNTRSRLGAVIKLLRIHQWVKNAFVLAPLFFTPSALSLATFARTIAGVLCFCAVSSAVYILNDYMDREADRLHPEKRSRPLAAGTVPVVLALALMATLAGAGLTGAYLLGTGFLAVAGAYLAINLSYSMGLKHVSILDVMLIALGFVLRVEAGAVLIDVRPSVWIILCTGLLALFMAIAKRRDDVVKALGGEHRKSLDGYNRAFLDNALALVLGALVVAYCIYTTDELVMERLGSQRLYLTVPFVIAGILRYLQITLVEERSGSPTRLALTDRFLVLTVLGWVATFGLLIYA